MLKGRVASLALAKGKAAPHYSSNGRPDLLAYTKQNTVRGRYTMTRWLSSVLPAVFVLAVALVLTGCGGGEGSGGGGGGGEAEQVKVASDIAYPPFEYNKGGEPTGFDIDLMNEIAKRANLDVEYQNVRFDSIIQGLGNNLYDAAISAMTITPEREEQIDFSEPYFNADQSLLVQSGSDIESTDDLGDATVGVQIGTTGAAEAQKLEEQGKVADVRTFNTVTDAFNALENGQVDAVINDFPVSADRASQSNGELEIVQNIPTGEQYGIAFPTDSELRPRVNKALQEIKEDGTYEKLYVKWFDEKPQEIP
jgi:polar amino acid transport system substrate-binding protein